MNLRSALYGVLFLILALFVVQRLVTKGDDGGPTPPTEREIAKTIETTATSTNSDYCDTLVTAGYLEQTTGQEPPYGDESCQDQAEVRTADSVDVEGIEVDGDTATATVTFTGGSFDGSRMLFRLARADGVWQMDRILAIPDLDREKMRTAYRRELVKQGYSSGEADCVLTRERRYSDEELKRGILEDVRGTFLPAVVACGRHQVEREVLEPLEDADHPFPAAARACVERKLRAATDAQLIRVFSPAAYGSFVFACDEDAYAAVIGQELESSKFTPEAATCVVNAFRRRSPAAQIKLAYTDDRLKTLIYSCAGLDSTGAGA